MKIKNKQPCGALSNQQPLLYLSISLFSLLQGGILKETDGGYENMALKKIT